MSIQTTEDGTDTSLPSFSTFSSELDPTWDYYDRDRSGSDVITSQSNNYTRPWEMETKEKGFEPFSKLPSFQSQFHSYAESNMMPEPSLPQVTPVPMSPNSVVTASPGSNTSLTQLTPINPLQTGLAPLSSPSFHTLTAVNTRPYGRHSLHFRHSCLSLSSLFALHSQTKRSFFVSICFYLSLFHLILILFLFWFCFFGFFFSRIIFFALICCGPHTYIQTQFAIKKIHFSISTSSSSDAST